MNHKPLISYWQRLAKGSGGRPGYRRILDKWLLLHIPVGIVLSFLVSLDLQACANTVLLPLTGILIGLSFAWAGNAHALLQTEEMRKLSKYHEGGFVEYVFIYQTAILTILVTLVFWGFAGLGIYDQTWPTRCNPRLYFTAKSFLFVLSSLTLRECWQAVSGAHWMLRIRKEIKDHLDRDKD
jgi:hypothetical protein